ncbi:phosphonate metabolism protein/1,5-bisphosphokinase (PRPP-forming) PhnN [uncultured Bartonella sp.]|uniref:phosphonate metabolism protein/1,5-bisphosphokinase (PRPP-forming) PhnN n=1 Tax=uncultured Bartonella sp. TaxID=104108 RepID=UPI0025F66916|nr:phosphonate metabolism protein/1,5-bisphosphokinase (PRPP-forming) PhnN [uncultured Bartonella sp.]
MLPLENNGWFVAIVGPSGAGKDTIINAVHKLVGDKSRFLFIRRIITRDAVDEDNISVTEAKFIQLRKQGAFSLNWFAHGIHYGLPNNIKAAIGNGKIVIANISRECVKEANQLFGRVFVVEINAPIEILRNRLANREREDKAHIEERLERAALPIDLPKQVAYHYIDNSQDVKVAVRALFDILQALDNGKVP